MTGQSRRVPPGAAMLLLVVITAVGCSSAGGGQAQSSDASATSVPVTAGASSAATSPGPGQFANPVYPDNFPDPGVLLVGTTFHAYGTQGGGANIQTLTSADLVHWTKGEDALPTLGHWATAGSTWAPEVIAINGGYTMFYVARDTASDKQCIGRATAKDPAGPFTDLSAHALVCQPDLGGSIDPNPVRDTDGRLYLYWKNDGNCCSQKVQLWGQQLAATGATLVDKPAALMTNTKAWQGNVVEAPEMLIHSGAHTLLYSAADYASTSYAVGYASCTGPLGPCTDKSDQPLLASTDQAAGPGHCFPLVLPNGDTWLIYHAWKPDGIGSTYPGRELWLDRLNWKGTVPQPIVPDADPQPDPVTTKG